MLIHRIVYESQNIIENNDVKNSDKDSNKSLSNNQKINDDGFCYIMLLNNDIFKKHLIHNLVKYAFIEYPDNHSIVNHVDGNLMNNKIDNLKFLLVTEPYKINFRK